MRPLSRRAFVTLAVVALPLGGTGCGSYEEAEAVRSTVEELQEAFAAGRYARVCDLMTEDARRHMGSAGHGGTSPCTSGLQQLSGGIGGEGGRRAWTTPLIAVTAVEGRRATAMALFGNGASTRLPLVKRGDGWRVDALYGGIPGRLQEDKY
jgi:hypothetical protein